MPEDEYINADFILASTAEVERLWSLAKYIWTDTRKHMMPIVFESLLFLKVNRRFWDQDLVSRAIALARTARSEQRLSARMIEGDLQQEDEDEEDEGY